ncbi:phage terminase, small subunit, putative, P27 family [Variovorax sp. HW608]|uniref:phage terminase small subunit P27 family n=1 Tax=Variovorax sp. HW608 TaxID=1034889 RepID=UPI00081FF7CD|nr:phage terminase small subunit P27 family [Variovorax sp. HW608]SCK49348.1 phage terminase, small subunit, putative, P27 family [Variovorax sp. HW608]
MSGPAPKATALALVDSGGKLSTAARRRAKHEAQVLDALGDPPEDFTDAQRAAWVAIAKLAPVGLLTSADREVFAGFVVTAVLRAQTLQLFNRSGGHVLVRDNNHNQLVLNPLMREYRRMTEQLRALSSELGFSPASRARLASILANGEGDGDELMNFLAQGRA